jgi:hypothetical protein
MAGLINHTKTIGFTKATMKVVLLIVLTYLPSTSFASVLIASSDTIDCDYTIPCAWDVLSSITGGTAPFVVATTSNPINGGSLDLYDNNFTYYAENNLSGTDTFTYEVTDSLGATSSATFTINIFDDRVDVDPPSVPGSLLSELTGGTYVRLNWVASSDNIGVVGYKIYKKNSGNYVEVADIDALTYLDSGLSPNTSYFYKVSAYDEAGNEATSTELSVTTVNNDDYNLLLDTGLPTSAVSGNMLNQMSFAHKFVTTKTEKITKLSAYITNPTSAQNLLTFVVYSNTNGPDGDIPDQELATTTLIFTPGQASEARWRETSNLNIILPAGIYWFAIEERGGDNSDGWLPTLKFDSNAEALRSISGTYDQSSTSTLQHGFRIYSDSEPIISNISSVNDVSTNGVLITWTTNELSTSTIDYGLTTGYGSSSSSVIATTSHSMLLIGLTASTTYNFKISSWDLLGSFATSTNYIFTTPSTTINSVTSSATEITANISWVMWTLDGLATSTISYGLTTEYGSTSSIISTTSRSVLITGLATSTPYHFKISSWDSLGNLSTSTDYIFTTLTPPDVISPNIISIATSTTETTATITWATDEPVTSILDYGTDLYYGNEISSDSLGSSYSFSLTGLNPSTSYHFQITFFDSSDNDTYSTDYTFTTKAAPVVVTPAGGGSRGGGGGGGGGGSGGGGSSLTLNLNGMSTSTMVIELRKQLLILLQQLLIALIEELKMARSA